MPSTTTFIALQCCRCSTMQVKQRKKSSNKWVCVVCNQKQSVRKVFAQGHMAKDLRKFVQNFNMSRKTEADQQEHALLFYEIQLPPSSDQTHNLQHQSNQSKRRSNWNEYLHQEDRDIHSNNYSTIEKQEEGDECEPRVVTELSMDMFKKPRLEKYSSGLQAGGGSHKKLLKPVFSRQNTKLFGSQGRESMNSEPQGSSKWIHYMAQDDKEAREFHSGPGKIAYKWSNCVTVHDDAVGGDWHFRDTSSHAENEGQRSNGFLEAITNDVCVEDDVHPDFL